MQKTLLYIFVFFFSILILSINAFSQNKEIDSLEHAFKIAKTDTDKINTAYYLCSGYKDIGEYNKALRYGNVSLKLSEKLNDKSSIAHNLNIIGLVYKNVSDYPTAIDYFFKSLKIQELLKNKDGIATSYSSIGEAYRLSGNLKKSLEYQLKTLKIRLEEKDPIGIASTYNNLGNAYFEMKNFDLAIDNYSKCLKIAKELDNKFGIALSLNNLGSVYYEKLDYAQSLDCFLKSLKLGEEIDDKQGVAITCGNLSNIYYRLKDCKAAIAYGQRSVKIAQEIGDIATEDVYQKALYDAYKITGNLSKALEHFERATVLHDSIYKEENKQDITRKEMTYEFEKKEAEAKAEQEKKDIEQKIKSKHQDQIIYVVSAGLLLVIIFSFFLYNRFKLTQRQNKIIEEQKVLVDQKNASLNELNEELNQQNEEISAQRDEIENQKQLVEGKHKAITDSINYAERIQRSFLASNELLKKNLKEHFVFFKPKDVVSGDFYWAIKLNNGAFALATADSTGHGVPGAIMSILNISSLEKAVERGLSNPSEILNATRKTIIERLKKDGSSEGGKDGMDASLICFDFANNKFNYAAANNPVWVIRANNLIELAFDKMPVGKHERDSVPFNQHEFITQKGDIIYTLTDGFPDQFGGPRGKKFLYKQLKELLISVCQEPMEIQKQKLNTAFVNWKGHLEQIDDVCLIGIRV